MYTLSDSEIPQEVTGRAYKTQSLQTNTHGDGKAPRYLRGTAEDWCIMVYLQGARRNTPATQTMRTSDHLGTE